MVRNSYDVLSLRKTLGDSAETQETTMNYVAVMWNKIIEQSREIEALKAFAASVNKEQYDSAKASVERKTDVGKNMQKSKPLSQQQQQQQQQLSGKALSGMLSDEAIAELLRSRGNGNQLNLDNLNIKSIMS
jgi:hypothetical protein